MTKARLGKRLGAAILAWAILISMAMLPGAFADASDVDAYQTIEDFEGMTADADVTGYWTFGKDGDTPGTLALAAGKGENGTKATALSYNLCYSWSWMHLARTVTVKGDGLRVWIKNEHDLYVKANFVSDGAYVGEYLAEILPAGEHVLSVKWADIQMTAGQEIQMRLNFNATAGTDEATVYVDNLGYLGLADEQPEKPEKPEDPFGAYTVWEDFEKMSADADVSAYWEFGKDGDTPAPAMTLATDKGENGTKATALAYNLCYNWSWMHLAKTIRAEGDGFRVWIKNEHDLYVKANFVSDGMYVGEYQEGVLLAGEHILGVKWADVGIARGQTLQLRLQFEANSDPHAATVYVDDLGFIGAAEQPEEPEKPEDPFGAFAAIQDFEKMSSDADVTRYWALSRDPDTPAPTLTLAEGKGENGSKAAALSYNMPYSWSWMYLAQNVTVSGDAFRLWIKNEHDLYVKANFVSDGAYVGEYQAGVLLAGEHILGIKWADAGFTEGQTLQFRLEFGAGGETHASTVYIDNIGLTGDATVPEPGGEESGGDEPAPADGILFRADRPNTWADGDPAWAWRETIDGDARFNYMYEIHPLPGFTADRNMLYFYNRRNNIETADITNYVADGYLRFWYKGSAAGKKFTVALRECRTWNISERTTVTVKEAGVWTEARIRLSDIITSSLFCTDALETFVCTGNGLDPAEAYGEGDVLKLAGITVYTGEPPAVTDWDGKDHDTEAPADNGSMDDGTHSKVLWRSDFDTPVWPDVEGLGTITQEITDELPGDLDTVYKWVIGNNFDEPTRSVNFYSSESADVSAAMPNGYLYFWARSSKANVSLLLTGRDDIRQSGKPVIFTIEKANEWQMIRIRIKDLLMNGFDTEYFNSIAIGDPYGPYSWSSGSRGYSGEGYLAEGDVLCLSQMFISSGYPVDPAAKIDEPSSEDESSEISADTSKDASGKDPEIPDTGVVSLLPTALLMGAASLAVVVRMRKKGNKH